MTPFTRRIGAYLLMIAAFILAGLVYFVHVARTGLLDRLSDWAAQRRAQGWTVEAQVAPPLGSLFSPVLELRDVNIAGGTDWVKNGFALSADRVDMRIDLTNPALLHVTVLGHVGLRLASLPQETFTTDHLNITVKLRASLGSTGGHINRITIDGKNLHDSNGNSVGILDAQLVLDDAGAVADLRTEAIVVPFDAYGLGRHISDLTMTASLLGWPPTVGSRAARADIWQAGGGHIQISTLVLGWGPLGLVGHGDLGLDQSLQPDGHANLQVRGYQTLLAGLGNGGATVDSLAPANGDAASMNLRLKKNTLSVDRIGLLKIPRIDW